MKLITKLIIVFLCSTGGLACADLDIHYQIIHKGNNNKNLGTFHLLADSQDSIGSLIQSIKQDLIQQGFPINTTAQKQKNMLDIHTIETHTIDLMAPGLHNKPVATVLPKAKQKKFWQKVTGLYEVQPARLMFVSVELV